MSRSKNVSRRSFVKNSASALGLAAIGVPAVNAVAANEKINIGCIGIGGRCRQLAIELVKIPNVRIAAVCDIWDAHLDEGRKFADPKALATKEYRKALDRKDIDAVLIAT